MAASRRIATLAAVGCVLAGCGGKDDPVPTAALAPVEVEVPRPVIRVGDYWEYEVRGGEPTARWSLAVVEADGGGRFKARRGGGNGATAAGASILTDYDGPWNVVLPPPYASLEYLRFPLRQDLRWTSVAASPTIGQTRTLTQHVAGRQRLALEGASYDCVRVDGRETTTSLGTPAASISVDSRLWYCPALRAVARAETTIPLAPMVTQTLVAHRLQP